MYVQYNRKATSNDPLMDDTVTSGLKVLKCLFWCMICPLVQPSCRRTLTPGPGGVRLREVRLYHVTRIKKPKMKLTVAKNLAVLKRKKCFYTKKIISCILTPYSIHFDIIGNLHRNNNNSNNLLIYIAHIYIH